MSQLLDPITQRDYSAGRIAKSAVATALMTNFSSHSLTSAVNSVSNSENVDFSEIIGSGIVRKAKTLVASFTTNQQDGQAERVSNPGDELKAFGTTLQAQTFTPVLGQETTYGIALRLYFLGSTVGVAFPPDVTVSLNTTSAGKPTNTVINGNSWTFPATNITSNSSGAVIVFPTSPGTVLVDNTVYAIVLQFPNGDSSDCVEWIRNSGTSYAGGASQTSTDGGATWSNNTGANYFAQEIANPGNPYSLQPLTNFSFLNAGQQKNVVGFQLNSQGFGAGVIYYYNATHNQWYVSDLFYLAETLNGNGAVIRCANMNGYVFEANGVQQMMSSADFGATWGVANCITSVQDSSPIDLRYATVWSSSITYAVGNLVTFGSFTYISIQNGSNKQPDTQPAYWTQIQTIAPSLLIVAGNRMLASGVSQYPSRVYFSSLVSPTTSPFLTWNIDESAGDFIDINPDDGGVVTGFANNSTLTLVFKNNAMYRLNAISKTVDPENVFNVGAISQEAIVNCLGITYFYSGNGFYSTDGTFPQLISRIGVQDFVNVIQFPQTVTAGTDGFNVYFSIGTITLTFGPNDTRTFNNVVLKFSPRDQNWQVFTYQQQLGQMSQFGAIPLDKVLTAQWSGDLSTVNSTQFNDDGLAIPYFLETQEQEFGNRAHTKDISDKVVVYTRFGGAGQFLVKQNDSGFKSANTTMERRVNVGTDVNFEAQFFTFRWQGAANGARPIFEGYHLPKVTDLGITQNDNTPN